MEIIEFKLPNKEFVPKHFHITEVGKITKNFIDCGGNLRNEEIVNFQLWNANDFDHRLHPKRLLKIIKLSEKILKIDDLDIEVEYQAESISKFALDFDGKNFLLKSKQTDCLSKDNCGIPLEIQKIKLSDLNNQSSCSTLGTCC